VGAVGFTALTPMEAQALLASVRRRALNLVTWVDGTVEGEKSPEWGETSENQSKIGISYELPSGYLTVRHGNHHAINR